MGEQGADDELVEVIDAGGHRVTMTRGDAWQAGLQPIGEEPPTDTEPDAAPDPDASGSAGGAASDAHPMTRGEAAPDSVGHGVMGQADAGSEPE